MLDFTSVREKRLTLTELCAGLTLVDLRRLTTEMIDAQLGLIEGTIDEDVVFVPSDPDAHDEAASDESEVSMPWTLGHVIVHNTASSEEYAFLAAELARGVEWHGRSRYEVHWTTITTIAQVRQRLEDSRRMRLAMLDVWPDPPHLENFRQFREGGEKFTPVMYFVLGLRHEDSHLAQIAEIVRQSLVARQSVA